MAEFHAAGFSEFDKFFGGDSRNEKEDLTDSLVPKESKTTGKGKRGGVGSKVVSTLSAKQSSTELSKRLLKVGTKRSRNQDAVDEEDENTNENTYSEQADDDDEEDAGRTGIPSKEESSVKSKKNEMLDEIPPSKKTKQGKKERHRSKEEADKQSEEITNKDEVDEVGESIKDNKTENVDEATNARRKPKRRKIRSKQKNIRKDSRAMAEKPKHLRVGASNYQGRPLTDETRARLNLAPSKTKANPFFVIDRSPVPNMEGEIALGVEDLLAESASVEENKDKKKKQKKRKRKYKNL